MSHQNPHVGRAPSQNDFGEFNGGSFNITHRDTNAVLNLNLQKGTTITCVPGAMIHMSGTITLVGERHFSFKKLITGYSMSESKYSGPGRVALGPTLFGDIVTLRLNGPQTWMIGRDAYLASTDGITGEQVTQSLSKSLLSGEDLVIQRIGGEGIIWLTSFGAVDRLDLHPGEEHIVDNGHLVAWSCEYKMEKAGGGTRAAMKTGEGFVCRFTGPGSVYIQTRNQGEFEEYISNIATSSAV
ncbi:DUF124 domain protein [Mariannaea sp. PMI_226]|nr:DUF124 domain protein [Mariannaea sp. PMI_226]